MAEDYVKMLERFAEYRKSLAMMQANVAERLGVTQSRFSKGESGRESISNDFLTALYEGGWDIDYVVAGIKRKKKKKLLRDELIDFTEDKEVFKIIYWAMYNQCKAYSDFKRYSLELNLLNFMCHHDNVTVFEAVRRINNINQLDYAERLNLTIKKCRSLEKGIVYPTADLIRHIYNMFGCRPTLLLKSEGIIWNLLENIWGNIPSADEKTFVNFINNAIIYYNQISRK